MNLEIGDSFGDDVLEVVMKVVMVVDVDDIGEHQQGNE